MHATGGLRRHPWTLIPVVHPEHGDRPQEQETPTSQTQRAPCWAGAPQPLTTQAGLSTQSLRQNSRDHQCPDQTLPDCASCWGGRTCLGRHIHFLGTRGDSHCSKNGGSYLDPTMFPGQRESSVPLGCLFITRPTSTPRRTEPRFPEQTNPPWSPRPPEWGRGWPRLGHGDTQCPSHRARIAGNTSLMWIPSPLPNLAVRWSGLMVSLMRGHSGASGDTAPGDTLRGAPWEYPQTTAHSPWLWKASWGISM